MILKIGNYLTPKDISHQQKNWCYANESTPTDCHFLHDKNLTLISDLPNSVVCFPSRQNGDVDFILIPIKGDLYMVLKVNLIMTYVLDDSLSNA